MWICAIIYWIAIDNDSDFTIEEEISPLSIDENIFKENIKKFSDFIVRSNTNPGGYLPENIFVIETLYAEKIVSNNGYLRNYTGDYKVKEYNEFLKKLYSHLYKCLPGCRVIKLPQWTHASENHMWGGHPLHYTEETYLYFLKVLDFYLYNRQINTPQNLYREQSLKNRIYTRSLSSSDVYKIKDLEKRIKFLEEKLAKLENLDSDER